VKILLDECIDRRFAREIKGHEVQTFPQAGWAGIKNGELLTKAQAQFDAFVTVDRNLAFQKTSLSSPSQSSAFRLQPIA
jgi:hypothetical protein